MTGTDLPMKSLPPSDCSVLIVGGGPCDLMLANELGRRGITAILVDQKPTTAFNPQAKAGTEPGSYTMNRENRYERAV